MEFTNVTAHAKANVYFDGNVVSHTIVTAEGIRKTLGVILPGSYHFGTDAPEHMLIAAGACCYTVDGTEDTHDVAEGGEFELPGKSGFTISVEGEPCHYVCTFL